MRVIYCDEQFGGEEGRTQRWLYILFIYLHFLSFTLVLTGIDNKLPYEYIVHVATGIATSVAPPFGVANCTKVLHSTSRKSGKEKLWSRQG